MFEVQIRLSQAVGDWVRVPLTIQKVNVSVLKTEGMEVMKNDRSDE